MVETTVELSSRLRKQLEQASPDLLRAMVKDFAEELMGAGGRALRRDVRRARNLLTRVPKSAQGFVATMVRSIFADSRFAPRHDITGRLRGRTPDIGA